MRILLAFLVIAAAGCATVRQPELGGPVPEPAAPLPEPAARTDTLPLAGLPAGARADVAAGRCGTKRRAISLQEQRPAPVPIPWWWWPSCHPSQIAPAR